MDGRDSANRGVCLPFRVSGVVLLVVVKNPSANAEDVRDVGSIPGLGRFPGGGNGNRLQYSCLKSSMDRGAWWVMVHRVTELNTIEAT